MNIGYLITEEEENTLMITRRTLTVPKTTLVCIMLEISFARLTSMAAFNEMVTLSRSFDRWDLVVMVATRKRCGVQAVNRNQKWVVFATGVFSSFKVLCSPTRRSYNVTSFTLSYPRRRRISKTPIHHFLFSPIVESPRAQVILSPAHVLNCRQTRA